MKTKMIVAAFGLSGLFATGTAMAASDSPHEPYYEGVQSGNKIMTAPHGTEATSPATMEGKAAYGDAADGTTRYSEKVLTGKNKNTMNPVTDPAQSVDPLPEGAGHKAYDRVTEPD